MSWHPEYNNGIFYLSKGYQGVQERKRSDALPNLLFAFFVWVIVFGNNQHRNSVDYQQLIAKNGLFGQPYKSSR